MRRIQSWPGTVPKIPDLYFFAAVVFAAIILLVTLLLPLGFDNDVYQSMGYVLWTYHGLPYLASWDMNFPGIVFVHAASIALLGNSDFGFRMFDYLVHVVMAGMLYLILRHWLRGRESLIAVLLVTLYYVGGQWGLAGQRDEYALFFILSGILLLFSIRERGASILRSLALGLSAGAAIMVRPTYVFFAGIFLLLLIDLPNKKIALSFFLTGISILWILFLTPYLFITGGIEQVYHSIIRFNLDVYSSIEVPRSFFSIRSDIIYILALAGILCLVFVPSRDDRRRLAWWDRKLLVLYVIGAILSPIVMGKYFSYHLQPIMLVLLVLSAVGLARLSGLLRPIRLELPLLGVAVLLFASLFYPRHLVRYYLDGWSTTHPIDYTYERVLSDSLFGLRAQTEVANYINNRTHPDAPIEYATLFPNLRWRLGHPPATRFTTLVPLAPSLRLVPDYITSWRREYIASLAGTRPPFIILSRSHEWWPFVQTYADSTVHLVAGFDSLLAANYNLDTVIRGYTLYKSKP
jgi:hypothetical protein